jgi:hypothetical protein
VPALTVDSLVERAARCTLAYACLGERSDSFAMPRCPTRSGALAMPQRSRPAGGNDRRSVTRCPHASASQTNDNPGVKLQDDQLPAEASRTGTVSRLQARTAGYVARHPAILRMLGWLGWNNPDGSMNP